jgi:hypothetical protein
LQSDTGTETDWVWDMDMQQPVITGMGDRHPGVVSGRDVHIICFYSVVWIRES